MTESTNFIAVVLAGGKGKRMNSDLPKVLHLLAGKPLVTYITDTLSELAANKVVLVVGHGRDQVKALYPDSKVDFAVQEQQLGTGDAVRCAVNYFTDYDGDVFVINGDVPLLKKQTLQNMLEEHRKNSAVATVLTSKPDDPSGYGRVIRDAQGYVKEIVEHADANDEQLKVGEINTGIYLFDAPSLLTALEKIDCGNAQGEYYLTDVVKIFLQERKRTSAVLLADFREALGVNSREQLEQLEKIAPKIKNIDKELGKV